jgi:predicted component of type VI protein secretion system
MSKYLEINDLKKFSDISIVNLYNIITKEMKINETDILFKCSLSLAKSSKEIEDINFDRDFGKVEITVSRYIFFGENGVLPDFINELVLYTKEKYFLDFINIFADRILKIYIKSINFSSTFYNLEHFSDIFSIFSTRSNNEISFTNNLSSIFFDFYSTATLTKILRNFLEIDIEILRNDGEFSQLYINDIKKIGKDLILGQESYIGGKFWNSYICIKIFLIIKNDDQLNYVIKDEIKSKIIHVVSLYLNNMVKFQIRTRLLYKRKSHLNFKNNPCLLGINTVIFSKSKYNGNFVTLYYEN